MGFLGMMFIDAHLFFICSHKLLKQRNKRTLKLGVSYHNTFGIPKRITKQFTHTRFINNNNTL